MGKRIWVIAAAVVLLAVVGIIGVLKVNRHYEGTSPLKHMPNRTAVVVRMHSLTHLRRQIENSDYKDNLCLAAGLTELDSMLTDFELLARQANLQEPDVLERELFAGLLCDTLSGEADWLFATRINNYLEGRNAMKMLRESGLTVRDTTVGDYDVLTIERDSLSAHVLLKGGCLFASRSMAAVSAVGRTGMSKALYYDDNFATLERTASQGSSVSVFVNMARMDDLGLKALEGLATLGVWSEFDVELGQKSIEANGFMLVNEGDYVATLSTQASQKFVIDSRIPSCAPVFMAYAPAKRGLSCESFGQYLAKRSLLDAYTASKQKHQTLYKTDIEQQLADIFSGSLALFSFNGSLDDPQETCLVLGADNGTLAQASLNALLGAVHKVETPAQIELLSPVPNVNVPVYEAFRQSDDIFFLRHMLPAVPRRYYLRFENTLLFANNISVLRRTLYEILLNRTLATDADFRNFRLGFSASNSFFYYCNSSALSPHLQALSRANDMTLDRKKALGNFYAVGLQVSSLGGRPYLSAGTLYEPSRIDMPPTLWQSRLDTTVTARPFAVTNHNTQETEFLVQDSGNRLYLINSKGLVLWQRQLDGPILGDVTQIDYYLNRKLQYLFATEDNIHLIDRNGNNTAQFPISLPQKAVGGATYLDYGNPREFRIFVPCADRMIRLYDRECKNIQGWEMPPSEGLVHGPIDHWVAGNKDYLLMADDYRAYIVNRRGNERYPLKPMAPNAHSRYYLVRAKTASEAFVTSTADGHFASIKADNGSMRLTEVLPADDGGHFFFALGQSRTRFAFVSQKRIAVVDDEGRVQSNNPIYVASVAWAALTPDGNIALWDKDEQLGYVFTPEGKLVDGFPIPAASPFAISKSDGITHVVVAAPDGSLCDFLK